MQVLLFSLMWMSLHLPNPKENKGKRETRKQEKPIWHFAVHQVKSLCIFLEGITQHCMYCLWSPSMVSHVCPLNIFLQYPLHQAINQNHDVYV